MSGCVRRRGLTLVLGGLALAVAHRSAFSEVWPGTAPTALDRALYAPSMASPILALGVAAWLAVRRRALLAEIGREARGRMIGVVPLAIGIGLLLWSRRVGYDHLVLPALLSTLVGGALAIGGARLLRAIAWPLAALGLATPLPPALLHPIVFPLQLWTVSLTSSLLALLGRAHEVRGDLIVEGGVVFQVIEGCSGFKTIVSLMLAAVLYADLVLRRPGAQAALVLTAVPVAIGANALRVLALVLGRVPAESATHTAYGILAMVGGVVALALIELTASRLCARLAPPVGSAVAARAAPSAAADPPAAADGVGRSADAAGRGDRGSLLRPLVLVVLIVAAIAAETLPRGPWPLVRPAINIETLPETLAGRTARSLQPDAAFLGTVTFGHQIHRAYVPDASGAPVVRVFIGHEDVSRPDRSGWSPKTAIPGSGWRSITRVPASDAAPSGGDRAWQRWSIDYPDRRVLVAHRRIGFAPWGCEVALRWLGLDRLGWLGRRRSPLVVRIEADDRGGSAESTWMSLRQFEAAVERWSRGEEA